MRYTVYFITEDKTGYTKIGYTKSVDVRIKELQTGNPRRLFLSACIEGLTNQAARSMESYLHRRFTVYRLTGEWFTSDIFQQNWFTEKFKMPHGAIIKLVDMP